MKCSAAIAFTSIALTIACVAEPPRVDTPFSTTAEANQEVIASLPLGAPLASSLHALSFNPVLHPSGRFYANPFKADSFTDRHGVPIDLFVYITGADVSQCNCPEADLTPLLFKAGILRAKTWEEIEASLHVLGKSPGWLRRQRDFLTFCQCRQ